MAINLSSIVSGKVARAPRTLLYGTDGIGKSSFAADAPNPIFTQTEDRLSHIDCAKFPLSESFKDALETVQVLIREDHDYKTHVTDSLDWLEKLIHVHICKEAGEESIKANAKGSPLSYGRGYEMAAMLYRKYLLLLDKLWKEKNMQIIIIAHADITRFEDPLRDSYDKYWPNVHKAIRDMTQQWVDNVFFCNHRVSLKAEDAGFGKEKKKAIGRGDRIIYTEERPAFEAKNSYDLPPELPLKKEAPFQEFMKHYLSWLEK